MALELYKQVVINRDIPEEKLHKGDLAVLLDFVEHPTGGEKGAILEIFNILGESIDVVTVPVSAVAELTANQMPGVSTRAS